MTEVGGHFIKINLDTCKAQYLTLKEQMDYSQSAVIYAEEECIYVIVNRGEYLLKYFVNKNKCQYFHIKMMDEALNCFASVMKCGKDLIIVPVYGNGIIRINVETGKVVKDIIGHGDRKEREILFAKCNIKKENQMWMFFNATKEAIRYDMLTGNKVRYSFPHEIESATDVEFWNNQFYVLDKKGNIYRWNIGQSAEIILKNPYGEKLKVFSLLHLAGNQIWMMPLFEGAEIISYNMMTEQYKRLECYPKDFQYTAPEVMGKYSQKIRTNQSCYFAMHAGNHIFYIDEKCGEGKWLHVIWPDEKETLSDLLSRKNHVIKEIELDLECFLMATQTKRWSLGKENKSKGTDIWKYLSKNV